MKADGIDTAMAAAAPTVEATSGIPNMSVGGGGIGNSTDGDTDTERVGRVGDGEADATGGERVVDCEAMETDADTVSAAVGSDGDRVGFV
jgi:hypothetical protein